MFLARVQGHIVATQKDPKMTGHKLLIVEPLRVTYDAGSDSKAGGEHQASGFEPTGRAIVAIDSLGAGEDELVLVTQGSSARQANGFSKLPVDAVIVGIVDEAVVMGTRVKAS